VKRLTRDARRPGDGGERRSRGGQHLSPSRCRRCCRRAEQAAPFDSAPRGAGAQVLIVEDNDDTRAMLHDALRFAATTCARRATARAASRSRPSARPTVALIESACPTSTATKWRGACARARPAGAWAWWRSPATASPKTRRAPSRRAFDAHLTKPVAPERLKQVMAGLR
jgi:CheY-like chemotaxis protein